jgi:hypothetical protein
MRIELDKGIFLNGDKYSCWITMERKSKGEKSANITENLTGYHGNLTLLFHSLADKKILSGRDYKNLRDIANKQDEIHKMISAYADTLNAKWAKVKAK